MSSYMQDKEQIFEDAFQRLSAGATAKERRGGKVSLEGSASERRARSRAIGRFPVELETADGKRLLAYTVDLSEGGMKLDCELCNVQAGIRQGDTIKVVLNSPFLAAKNVRVIKDFEVLACEPYQTDTLRVRLQAQDAREGYATSPSGLQPNEFVMPSELEDTFMQTQAQVNLQLPDARARLLLFSGAEWGAGSSTLSWWFAVCLARTPERRVLFVDGNVHARSRETDAAPMTGFVELLLGQETLESTVLRLGAGAPDLLNVGRIGRFTSGEITQSDVCATFDIFREHYDYIIVDAPPALESSLTMLWAQSADGCLLVLESGKSQRDVAQASVARLRQSGARVLGAMLNKV
ncbi:MAG: CpsD/CapB family tyrosine-protein kinase [Halioglobus sp.]